jgi:hypothetical protein
MSCLQLHPKRHGTHQNEEVVARLQRNADWTDNVRALYAVPRSVIDYRSRVRLLDSQNDSLDDG